MNHPVLSGVWDEAGSAAWSGPCCCAVRDALGLVVAVRGDPGRAAVVDRSGQGGQRGMQGQLSGAQAGRDRGEAEPPPGEHRDREQDQDGQKPEHRGGRKVPAAGGVRGGREADDQSGDGERARERQGRLRGRGTAVLAWFPSRAPEWGHGISRVWVRR